jgi:hypothetical protein
MKMPHLSSVLALVVATGLATAEKPQPAADARFILKQFNVARDGEPLFLPVTFKGRKYLFLVDTGATLNCFDRSLPLGKPKGELVAEAPDGPAKIPLYDPPDAAVGGWALRSGQPVAGLDFKKFEEASGYEFLGILGMDFLRNHIIQIDFDAGKLTFLKEAGREPGVAVPIIFSRQNRPCVAMDIGGWGREEFLVDTGCFKPGSGCLRSDLFASLLEKKHVKEVGQANYMTLKGESEERIGKVRRIAVGELSVRDAVFGGTGTGNVLGLGYLSRYTVTFDFPRKMMYLKKGRRFPDPDGWCWTGLAIQRVDGKTTVQALSKDSPAASSGLREGDIILWVGDKAADESSLAMLREILCSPQKDVRIKARRGDKEMEVTLVWKAEAPVND